MFLLRRHHRRAPSLARKDSVAVGLYLEPVSKDAASASVEARGLSAMSK